jgi:hypothetical protein
MISFTHSNSIQFQPLSLVSQESLSPPQPSSPSPIMPKTKRQFNANLPRHWPPMISHFPTHQKPTHPPFASPGNGFGAKIRLNPFAFLTQGSAIADTANGSVPAFSGRKAGWELTLAEERICSANNRELHFRRSSPNHDVPPSKLFHKINAIGVEGSIPHI